MSDENLRPDADRPELDGPEEDALEAQAATEAEAASAAAASDTFEQAADGIVDSQPAAPQMRHDEPGGPQPAAKLERLQKILAQAGIASRRHAEELITRGRVQVNGKVITELGSKADPARDHIRVDGKLLQGSERLRYFMLNKPRGFVTTVNDPEGRPTVMQFFSKMRERLYPVGRLDYMSEGLLLVTNDGELANKLTRAASNVEKTYLVKVSGQPTEEEIDRLRAGVGIDRGKPGSGRVQTAPAQVRRFRRNDKGSAENPWFEVVLIEGRNRELRKMFEEIGHHVEKIRRVGYGPLVLDLEPGRTRELETEEIEDLRKAAEGKYRKPKPRGRQTPVVPETRFPPKELRRDQEPRGKRQPDRRQGQGRGEFRPGGRSRQRPPRPDEYPRSPGRNREGSTPPGPREQFRRPERGAGGFSRGDRREPEFGRGKRFGSRPPRPEFGRREEAGAGSRERRPFSPAGREARQRPGAPDQRQRRFEGNRQQATRRPGRFQAGRQAPFEGEREQNARFGRPRQERRGPQREEYRPPREERPESGSKPASGSRGFNARSDSGKKRNFGAKSGSVRSGGGRRPGSRPGRGPGGKKRG